MTGTCFKWSNWDSDLYFESPATNVLETDDEFIVEPIVPQMNKLIFSGYEICLNDKNHP